MTIELKNIYLIERLQSQAEAQRTTPAQLAEKILLRCMELGLIESMRNTTNAAEWGNEPLI